MDVRMYLVCEIKWEEEEGTKERGGGRGEGRGGGSEGTRRA